MKTMAHGESDVSSDHDSDPIGDDNSSGGEGSASSPTRGDRNEPTDQAPAQEEAVQHLKTLAENHYQSDVAANAVHRAF